MISEQLVKKVTGGEEIQRIYKLDFSNCELKTISNLKPYHRVRFLKLDYNRIRYMQHLEQIPDLRELHIQNNEISKIQGLQANKQLTILNMRTNFIEKIENISHLSKLETLLLDENKIERIVGLEMLKDLKNLSVSKNKLSSIDSLPAFLKLDNLNVSQNMIVKISSNIFTKNNKLTQLNLRKNRLKEINFLSSLVSLEWLDVSDNFIVNFPEVQLRNVEYININNNKLENLPIIQKSFPQIAEFHFSNNMITSQFDVIKAFSEADSLIVIDFRSNPIDSPEVVETFRDIYSFQVINGITFDKPGTKYKQQALELQKFLQSRDFTDIQDDQQDRNIKMSGFFDEELEQQMTGMSSNRGTNNPPKSKAVTNVNYSTLEKSYEEIMENTKKIEELRASYKHILYQNNIVLPEVDVEEEKVEKQVKQQMLMTEIKNIEQKKMLDPSTLRKQNEQQANRWKQIKNRDKNFNIRGVVRKMSGSRKKPTKEGSSSKIIQNERDELMRTQPQPPRWNGDPTLLKTLSRPYSSRKKKQI